MTIDRELWTKPFMIENPPNWICPRCRRGILRPVEGSFLSENTGAIDEDESKYGGRLETDIYSFHFGITLRCNNQECHELVISCGEGWAEPYLTEKGEQEWHELFLPEYFYPPLLIFPIPVECPASVLSRAKASFKLFFADPPAAANYVRKAVEEILTIEGVRRYSAKGKRKPINLHDRIKAFEKDGPEIAKKLLALKWLGNEGSHSDTLTKEDIMDAYEILEATLDELYVGYRVSIDKKVAEINKREKPLNRRKK